MIQIPCHPSKKARKSRRPRRKIKKFPKTIPKAGFPTIKDRITANPSPGTRYRETVWPRARLFVFLKPGKRRFQLPALQNFDHEQKKTRRRGLFHQSGFPIPVRRRTGTRNLGARETGFTGPARLQGPGRQDRDHCKGVCRDNRRLGILVQKAQDPLRYRRFGQRRRNPPARR